MTRVPDTWEAIDWPEGGWIAPGACGGWHLVGKNWAWWQCPTCQLLTRYQSRQSLTVKQEQALALFYPEGDTK